MCCIDIGEHSLQVQNQYQILMRTYFNALRKYKDLKHYSPHAFSSRSSNWLPLSELDVNKINVSEISH